MIDMHIHVAGLGSLGIKSHPEILDGSVERVATALREEMRRAGVEQALAMGCANTSVDDPLGILATLRVAAEVPGLQAIGVADPTRTDPDHLRRVKDQLDAGRVKAFKAYSGYVYFGPDSPNYDPYYELAACYQVPFIFHTGDTYSTRAKVKYAHPLLIDEAAVDHPDVRFVMAHVGNPWLMDAAEVVYKNENVWADLSGLLVGNDAYFQDLAQRGVLSRTADRVADAMAFSERPDRFLYGSDWPFVPMATYRKFIEMIVPEPHRGRVFTENARALFQL